MSVSEDESSIYIDRTTFKDQLLESIINIRIRHIAFNTHRVHQPTIMTAIWKKQDRLSNTDRDFDKVTSGPQYIFYDVRVGIAETASWERWKDGCKSRYVSISGPYVSIARIKQAFKLSIHTLRGTATSDRSMTWEALISRRKKPVRRVIARPRRSSILTSNTLMIVSPVSSRTDSVGFSNKGDFRTGFENPCTV